MTHRENVKQRRSPQHATIQNKETGLQTHVVKLPAVGCARQRKPRLMGRGTPTGVVKYRQHAADDRATNLVKAVSSKTE